MDKGLEEKSSNSFFISLLTDNLIDECGSLMGNKKNLPLIKVSLYNENW